MRTRQMLADLASTAQLVWSASPGLFSLILCLSILLALVPAATLWVGKLLVDEVARAIAGELQNADVAYRRLAMLLALQVGIAIASSLVQTIYNTSRELWATRCRTASASGFCTRRRRSTWKASRTPRPTTRSAMPTTRSARGLSA